MSQQKQCIIEGCEGGQDGRIILGKYCQMHYARWLSTGDPGPPQRYKNLRPKCIIEGCEGLAGKTAACRKHWHRVNRTKQDVRIRALKYKFGITEDEYQRLLDSQNGVCKVCGVAEPGSNYKNFAIDHDHNCCPERGQSCGKCIRGLLCSRCNLVLGMVNDDTEVLIKMIDYLRVPTPIDETERVDQK